MNKCIFKTNLIFQYVHSIFTAFSVHNKEYLGFFIRLFEKASYVYFSSMKLRRDAIKICKVYDIDIYLQVTINVKGKNNVATLFQN